MNKQPLPDKLYAPIGGVNLDCSDIFRGETEAADILNLRVKGNKLVTREGFVQVIADTLDSNPILALHTFKRPEEPEVLFAFTAENIYRYNTATQTWTLIAGPFAAPVEFWSITNVTDNVFGDTVVAFGSNPPLPNVAEDDQAVRIAYRYNDSTSLFVPFTYYGAIVVVDENTGQTIPALGGTVGGSLVNPTNDTEFLVAGSASFYTLVDGTISTSMSEVGTVYAPDRFALSPTLATNFLPNIANSYVQKTGVGAVNATWQIVFGGAHTLTIGSPIYVRYIYLKVLSYIPRYAWFYHNRLLIASTYEGSLYLPWRVRWSDVGDITNFSELNYADLVDYDNSSIMDGAYQGNYLRIYKETCIVNVSHVGGNSVFSFFTVSKTGTIARRSVVEYNGVHYFLGKEDIYSFDGSTLRSISINSTGYHRVRDYIFNQLDRAKITSCFTWVYPAYDEIWFCISNHDNTFPTEFFIYNVRFNIWYRFQSSEVSAITLFYMQDDISYDELTGTMDEQTWSADSLAAASALSRMPMAALGSGALWRLSPLVATDAGSPITSRLITRDFFFGEEGRDDRIILLRLSGFGTSLKCSWSSEETINAGNFFDTQDIDISTTEVKQYFLDVVTRRIRFMITTLSAFTFNWLRPYGKVLEQFNK